LNAVDAVEVDTELVGACKVVVDETGYSCLKQLAAEMSQEVAGNLAIFRLPTDPLLDLIR
jgi:hypothetical protein